MNKEFFAWCGNGLGVILTAVQTNPIFQYLSLILTIMATLLSVVISCMTIWQKFKNREKLSEQDIQNLVEQLNEANEKIKELEEENE